jgi:hypothetical protein
MRKSISALAWSSPIHFLPPAAAFTPRNSSHGLSRAAPVARHLRFVHRGYVYSR